MDYQALNFSFGRKCRALAVAGLFLLAALLVSPPSRGHEPVGEVQYLGNEGLWVRADAGQALFDGLFVDGLDYYQPVPPEFSAKILDAEEPFDDIRLVLVSHVHGDHFDAKSVLDFLRANQAAALFAPAQVTLKVKELVDEEAPLLARVHTFDLAPTDEPKISEHGVFEIAGVAIPHGGGARMADIQNIAFRVTLADELTVLHLGDATTNPEAFERHRAFWQQRPLAAVFPPYWFLDDPGSSGLLMDLLQAERVIGIHVPVAALDEEADWRDRYWHDLFIRPGESRRLGIPEHEH